MSALTNTKSLSRELLAELMRLPEGEKVKLCIQCGTCSGSCPTSHAMDYTPRQVIAALRAGMLDKVLTSDTVWLCSSCYTCTVRCPSGIQFTDLMYALKRLGLKHGLVSRDARGQMLMRAFVEEVDATGRNPEMTMMAKYFLRTNPLQALGNLGFALRMYRKGRLKLGRHRVRAREDLMAMARVLEEGE